MNPTQKMRHPNSPSTLSNPNTDEYPDQTRPTFGSGLVGLRKKGIGVRAWLVLDSMGQAQVVEAGKHAIMKRTGLPARDLRVLDPLLSYPSTVLGREKAIVINLEHIKAIITAQEVLLLNARDPSVTPFVDELQRRLVRLRQVNENQGTSDEDNAEWTDLYALRQPQSADVSPRNDSCGFPSPSQGMPNEKGDMDEKQDWKNKDGVKVLPFEFIALEACLEAACSSLENEARTLEQEAHPALDKLTSKISTLNLERVRQIKSRLVALTGRVQKVRDELEHLLDDDEDMAEMYLTEKLAQLNLEDSSISSLKEHDADDRVRGLDERVPDPPEILSDAQEGYGRYGEDGTNPHDQDRYYGANVVLARSVTQTSTTHSAITKHLDVDELEMLLEAYFVQIDGTLNKLTTLREYVDDTEDYINIMLDDKQNHLLQMGVMLTTATLVISAFIVVVGVFGMNISISLFDPNKYGDREFLWTVGGGATGTLALYVMVMAWCKHKRLLE